MAWTRVTKSNVKQATPYCKNVDYSLLEDFILKNNIVSFRKDIGYGTTVKRFFENGGRSCGCNYLQMESLYGHPFIDHYMFFKNRHGDVIFTSQPYAEKDYILEQFNKYFSNEFELEIFDTNKSWYSPGQVILFTIRLKNGIDR